MTGTPATADPDVCSGILARYRHGHTITVSTTVADPTGLRHAGPQCTARGTASSRGLVCLRCQPPDTRRLLAAAIHLLAAEQALTAAVPAATGTDPAAMHRAAGPVRDALQAIPAVLGLTPDLNAGGRVTLLEESLTAAEQALTAGLRSPAVQAAVTARFTGTPDCGPDTSAVTVDEDTVPDGDASLIAAVFGRHDDETGAVTVTGPRPVVDAFCYAVDQL
jgi:hypothetical protein